MHRHIFNQSQTTKSPGNQLARESAILASFEFARAISSVSDHVAIHVERRANIRMPLEFLFTAIGVLAVFSQDP